MPKSAKVTQKVVKKESLTTKEKKVSKSQLAKNQSEESLSSIERKRVKNVAKKKDVTLQHKKELEAILNHHSRFVAIEDSEALYRKERSEDGVDFQNNNETLVPETFKKNALRREKGGVHSSLPKHFAPLDIQDSKVIKNAEPIRTAHRHITLALACLTILIILGSYVSPKGSAESVVFYPTSCLGGWISPNMAEGPPEVDENNDREKFSEGNSAILPSGTNADIYCGGFVGEFKKNTKPTKILVTVSWAKGYDIESKKNIISNSFASSSHEILDSSASTTVSFTSIESSNATTTNIVATSTEEPAHSNNGSGVNLDVTTVSTSTDLQVSPTNDIIASSTQDTSSITPSTPTLLIPTGDITVPQVDSTQQTETQPNLQPEAPRQAPQSTTESPLTPLSLLKQVVTLFAFGGAIKVYADEVVTPVDTSQSVSPEPAPALDTIPLPVTSTPILDQAVDTVSKTDALISTGNDSIDSLLQKADELLSKKVELPDISTTTLIVATQTIQSSEFFDSSASTSFPSSALLNEEASSSALLFSSSSVLIPNDMVATTTLAVSASSTIISVSTNAEDESPNNFLELLYTFDGVTWGEGRLGLGGRWRAEISGASLPKDFQQQPFQAVSLKGFLILAPK
jgi:hypothetical protein